MLMAGLCSYPLLIKTPSRMNNFLILFTSVVFAALCFGANPDVFSQSQNFPLGIVNGTDAEDGEFQYVVQLYSSTAFACGGAIIDERWILTAGHCISADIIIIVYGTNALSRIPPANRIIKVKRSLRHPKYYINRTEHADIPVYDVGLLELEEPIQFNDKVQRLKLADSNDVPFHVPGTLAGWGLRQTRGSLSPTLQKVELQLLNDSECFLEIKRRARFDGFNAEHEVCSDNHDKGQCTGDSGSPFVINGLGYGVVSWSVKPCGSSPGTYSRLTNPEYRDFIKNVTGV